MTRIGCGTWLAAWLMTAGLATAQSAGSDAWLGQGLQAYFSRDYSTAYRSLTAAADAGSRDPRVYYFRGLCNTQLGRTREAQTDFQRGAQLEAARPARSTEIGRSLQRVQGQARQALEGYRSQARLAVVRQQERSRQEQFALRQKAVFDGAAQEVPKLAANPGRPPAGAPAAAKVADPFAADAPAAKPAAADPFAADAPAAMPAKPAAADPFAADAPAAKPAAADPFAAPSAPAMAAKPAAPAAPAAADPFGTPAAAPAAAPPATPAAAPPAAGAPAAMPAAAAGAMPGTPEGTVREFKALSDENPASLWSFLPPNHQTEINTLVRDFGAKMDGEIWTKSFGLVGKLAKLGKDKRQMILAHPAVAALGAQMPGMDKALDGLATFLETLATSESSTTDGLKAFDGEKFLAGTGTKLIKQVVAAAPQTDVLSQREKIAQAKITVVEAGEDTATLNLEIEGQPSQEVKLKKAEGKWLPAELVDGWAEKMAMAKAGMQNFDVAAQKPQAMAMLGMVENVVDQLLAAPDEQAFQTVTNNVMAMLGPIIGPILGGAAPPGQVPPGQVPPGQVPPAQPPAGQQ